MSAPLVRYGAPMLGDHDSRLYGAFLVQPFAKSKAWIRTVSYPVHPGCNLITELAVRLFKILAGSIALALTVLPALIGRTIQKMHYSTLTSFEREYPKEIQVKGLKLPELTKYSLAERNDLLADMLGYATNTDNALSILRWGLDNSKLKKKYTSGDKTILVLALNLQASEITYISVENLAKWRNNIEANAERKSAECELLKKNGYRGVIFEKTKSAKATIMNLTICNPSCFDIQDMEISSATPMG